MKKLLLNFWLWPFFIFIVYGFLNYSGFCFKEMRYISDEEKIRNAIAVVNKIGGATYIGKDGFPDKYREIIPYEDVDDFLDKNPKCCEIIPYIGFDSLTDDPYPPSFWDRVFDNYNLAVRIRFKRVYVEGRLEKGIRGTWDKNFRRGLERKYEETVIVDYGMTNCERERRSTGYLKVVKTVELPQ